MKITKEQLKQIIKEELESVLEGHQSNDMAQYGLQGPGDRGTGGMEHSSPNEQEPASIVFLPIDGFEGVDVDVTKAYQGSSNHLPNYDAALRVMRGDNLYKLVDYANKLGRQWTQWSDLNPKKTPDQLQKAENWLRELAVASGFDDPRYEEYDE